LEAELDTAVLFPAVAQINLSVASDKPIAAAGWSKSANKDSRSAVAALTTAEVSSTAASECERAETEAGPVEIDFKNGAKTATSTAGTMLNVGVSARSCDPSQVSKYRIHIIL
jgi:hypothetical protein